MVPEFAKNFDVQQDSEQDDQNENDLQFPTFEEVTAMVEAFENQIGSTTERAAVRCRISWIWGEPHVPFLRLALSIGSD